MAEWWSSRLGQYVVGYDYLRQLTASLVDWAGGARRLSRSPFHGPSHALVNRILTGRQGAAGQRLHRVRRSTVEIFRRVTEMAMADPGIGGGGRALELRRLFERAFHPGPRCKPIDFPRPSPSVLMSMIERDRRRVRALAQAELDPQGAAELRSRLETEREQWVQWLERADQLAPMPKWGSSTLPVSEMKVASYRCDHAIISVAETVAMSPEILPPIALSPS